MLLRKTSSMLQIEIHQRNYSLQVLIPVNDQYVILARFGYIDVRMLGLISVIKGFHIVMIYKHTLCPAQCKERLLYIYDICANLSKKKWMCTFL